MDTICIKFSRPNARSLLSWNYVNNSISIDNEHYRSNGLFETFSYYML